MNTPATKLERPAGLDKFINTTFELCGHKKSQWIKEGTGGDTGIPAQYMHTSKCMFIEMRSRLYLGKDKGYMPTQYVIGASTIYVNDYWEDEEGNPVFENLSPEQGKAKKLTFRPGLLSIYGEERLEEERKTVMRLTNPVAFENGVLELGKYGDDPMLRKFIAEHEQNKMAPNAAENRDPTRLRLFMFQPLIAEQKAAKTPIVETFDDSVAAMNYVSALRTKTPKGVYEYNEFKMDAVLTMLGDGVGLLAGDVVQKFSIIARYANKEGQTFMNIINGITDDYKIEIGKATSLKVLEYTGNGATLVVGSKKQSIHIFTEVEDKEKMVEELVLYFLGTEKGKNDFKELKRVTEVAKIKALK